MQLRYVVVRLVPDTIRDEPINVGVILQSDQTIRCKFIEKIPKDWDLPLDLHEDIAPKLHANWTKRLSSPREVVYLSEEHEQREIAHTDQLFLTWLQQTHRRHLQISDIRGAEVKVNSAFDFETFLYRLYSIYVAPKPRPRKPPARSRLHAQVKREFAQLQLPPDKQIRERDVILGTFPWPVDFAYTVRANGHGAYEVGIGLVDLSSSRFIDKAKDLLATWVDIRNVRPEVRTITVIGGATGLEQHEKAIKMVETYSSAIFVFDREKEKLIEQVASELQAMPMFTDMAMERSLRQASRRLSQPSAPEKEGL